MDSEAWNQNIFATLSGFFLDKHASNTTEMHIFGLSFDFSPQ